MVLEYSRTLVLEYSTLVGESPEWMLKVRGVNRCDALIFVIFVIFIFVNRWLIPAGIDRAAVNLRRDIDIDRWKLFFKSTAPLLSGSFLLIL